MQQFSCERNKDSYKFDITRKKRIGLKFLHLFVELARRPVSTAYRTVGPSMALLSKSVCRIDGPIRFFLVEISEKNLGAEPFFIQNGLFPSLFPPISYFRNATNSLKI
jgi:hypothetical protein